MRSHKASKPALRICHLADIHLGYRRFNRLTQGGLNQREVDIAVAFREAVDRVIKLAPGLVIIAGDVFHSVRPSNLVISGCFKEIRRLSSALKCPIIIVAGNHESPKRVDTGCALSLLAEIDGVFVSDRKPEVFKFSELSVNVQCLPHPSLLRLNEYSLRADDSVAYNILVTHAQVGDKWMSDFGGIDIDIKRLNPHEWDYIALGHIHLHREVGLNAVYPGSIEHTASNLWMEAKENKGFIEIEFPFGKRRFHELTSPREIVLLEPIDGQYLEPSALDFHIRERLDSVPGGIEGKIIRLELKNVTRETFRLLNHKELRSYRSSALNLTLDVSPPQQEEIRRTLSAKQRSSLIDELGDYCGGLKEGNVSLGDIRAVLQSYWIKSEGEDETGEIVKPLEAANEA